MPYLFSEPGTSRSTSSSPFPDCGLGPRTSTPGTSTEQAEVTTKAPAAVSSPIRRTDDEVLRGASEACPRAPPPEAVRHHAPLPFQHECASRRRIDHQICDRLRDSASHCEYGDSATELVRDHLVCGVRDNTLQRTLLAVSKLTFHKAFELALLHESAALNSRLLSTPNATPVHYASPPAGLPKDQPTGRSCYRCGGNHYAKECRFKEAVCNYCHKKGHIQRVCRSRDHQQHPQPPPTKSKQKAQGPETHKMDGGTEGSSSKALPNASPQGPPAEPFPVDYNIFAVGTDKKVDPYLAAVEINGATLLMEIDTGSALTLISRATFSKLWQQGESTKLEHTPIRLRTYSREELEVVGRAVVRVRCRGEVEEELGLVVVGGESPSLLGRDWLGRLRLDWRGVQSINATSGTLEAVLAKHSDLFRDELGTMRGIKAKLHVSPGAKPRFHRPRSIPYALRSRVDQALENLVSKGTLEAVQLSQWAAPIVPVVKRDGSIRVCGDYKLTVNQVAQVDTYPLPLIQDIFASLANGKSFTKLDLAHAYQQLILDDDSRPYTTNPPTLWCVSCSCHFPANNGIPPGWSTSCLHLPAGESDVAHLTNLAVVLERLESAGTRLKREKCAFMIPEVEYLGHSISAKGIQPVSAKVRAIRDAPRPQDISQLRSFLGMLNYYGKFLPNLAALLRPLYDLLQSATTWTWGNSQEQAFCKAKELLSSAPLLTHYDPEKPLVLSCDASPYGVGAVLSHRMEDHSEQPVAYASCTLSSAERKYAQLDKEALSIVFGVKHFHQYLYGRKLIILSDHKPLQYLLGETRGIPPMASARIQRWALMLSAYNYGVYYRPGADHANADGLSRLPLPDHVTEVPVPGDVLFVFQTLEGTPVRAAQIRQWTDMDPVLSRVRRNVLKGWVDADEPEFQPYQSRAAELSVQDGCLLRGSRVIVPKEGREAACHYFMKGILALHA